MLKESFDMRKREPVLVGEVIRGLMQEGGILSNLKQDHHEFYKEVQER